MQPLSKIANVALDEITDGQFLSLPQLAITGLLNDFQFAWLIRFDIPYKFELLDLARGLCNGGNKSAFRATHCKNIQDIRNLFSEHIKEWHPNDDRVILSVSFDGKKIDVEWVEMNDYLKASNPNEVDDRK
ncbi:MAG: hypothetical protein H8E09_00520 [Gammaproteobacteria bacterium]|nr:hypothetical protein [Gammaproteobacteria bacterium]